MSECQKSRRMGTGVSCSGPDVAVLTHAYNGTLALAGLAIAIAGALGPAGWAAWSRTSAVLRAE